MEKTSLSETNSAFKKHWWKFLLLDALFLATAFLFFIYARARIKAYFALISAYAGQIANAEALIAQNSATGMGQMEELLVILGPLASHVKVFTFFIVPLVIFALWCIFQAPHYSLILRNKLLSATDYIRFIVFAAPFYAAGLLVLNKLFSIASGSFLMFKSWLFYVWLLLLLILLYLNQIFYAFTFKGRYREMVNGFLCAIKRNHVTLPSYMLYAFAWMLALIGMANLFLKWVVFDVNGMLIALIFVLAVLLLVGWARTFFTLKAGKCELG